MKLSFVIPCYRSENTIETVVQEICDTVATRSGIDYEIVLVNDCSPDGVWQVIKRLAANDNHIKGICLAKNFGQHCALMAGYGQATGDYVISLDDDGQTPASESFKLVDKLEEGFDVVYGYYEHSAQHLFRRFGTWVNKKMAEAIIGQPKTLCTTSFFIMRKFIVEALPPPVCLYKRTCIPRHQEPGQRRSPAPPPNRRRIGLHHRRPNRAMD